MIRPIFQALTLSVVGVTSAMAIEEPEFEVVATTDEYEIRRYEPFIVAETEVPGDFDSSGNAAFRILAGYIFGDNRATELTATATHSAEEETSVKMAMTAPVISTAPNVEEGESHIYAFVMPDKYDMQSLPIPLDSRVAIRTVPSRLMAARRYSGRWSEKNYVTHEQALREALERDGLQTTGEATLARYNGPFTPWFMRRNEVMIELERD